MDFFKKLQKGAIIGAAAILPGVSGGVLATVMGIYEPVLNALSGFFKNIKKNTAFLFPIVFGGGIGFLLAGKIIFTLMEHCENQAVLFFSGLVLGGIPALFRLAKSEGFKKRYIIATVAALFLSFTLSELSKIPISNPALRYFLGGGAYSFGSVVPGVSASFLLINMGIYKDIVTALSRPEILIPFAAGLVLVTLLLIRVISYIFARFHGWAYFSAIGLLLASILSAFPPIMMPLIDIPLFLLGLLIGFLFINP